MSDEQFIHKKNTATHYYYNKEMTILHRVDGPAIEYSNGMKAWYYLGIKYTEEDHKREVYQFEIEREKQKRELILDNLERDLKQLLERYPGVVIHPNPNGIQLLYCRDTPFVTRQITFTDFF